MSKKLHQFRFYGDEVVSETQEEYIENLRLAMSEYVKELGFLTTEEIKEEVLEYIKKLGIIK